MSIIEHYKREAEQLLRQSILNLNSSNEQADPQSQTTLDASPRQNSLIQQISENNNIQNQKNEVDYQAQQFLYFASQNKTKQRKCIVCKKINPKYRCPKCKVEYCSQQHFKTHNLFCTQRFFKEQVQDQLKTTKASKDNVKKMVELLKQNQEEIAKDEKQLIDQVKVQEISGQRLLQIQKMIENNEQVRLRPEEIKRFEQYLKEIETNVGENDGMKLQNSKEEQSQIPIFEQYRPYWFIQEGLSLYFLLNEVEIETFNESNNKYLLLYRQKAAKILHQKLSGLKKTISLKKISMFISLDLLQVIYISCLLFRSLNGQYLQSSEFIDLFLKIYDQNLTKIVSQSCSGGLSELLKNQINIFNSIKTRLVSLQNQHRQELKVILTWLDIIPNDCEKILGNKYLTLETLYRILQSIKEDGIKNEQNKDEKQKKRIKKSRLKIEKKIEFLLCFTNQIVFNEDSQFKNSRQIMMNYLKKECQQAKEYLQQVQGFKNTKQKQKMVKINNIIIPVKNK